MSKHSSGALREREREREETQSERGEAAKSSFLKWRAQPSFLFYFINICAPQVASSWREKGASERNEVTARKATQSQIFSSFSAALRAKLQPRQTNAHRTCCETIDSRHRFITRKKMTLWGWTHIKVEKGVAFMTSCARLNDIWILMQCKPSENWLLLHAGDAKCVNTGTTPPSALAFITHTREKAIVKNAAKNAKFPPSGPNFDSFFVWS